MKLNFWKRKKAKSSTKERIDDLLGKCLWELAETEGDNYALATGGLRVTRNMYYIFKVLHTEVEEIPPLNFPNGEGLNQLAKAVTDLEKESRKVHLPIKSMLTVLAVEEFVIFNMMTGYSMTMQECLDLLFSTVDVREQYDNYTSHFPESKTAEDLRAFIYAELLKIYDIVYPRIMSDDQEQMEEIFPIYIQDLYKRYHLNLDELNEFGKKYGARVSL